METHARLAFPLPIRLALSRRVQHSGGGSRRLQHPQRYSTGLSSSLSLKRSPLRKSRPSVMSELQTAVDGLVEAVDEEDVLFVLYWRLQLPEGSIDLERELLLARGEGTRRRAVVER